jgi:hypothetical protein
MRYFLLALFVVVGCGQEPAPPADLAAVDLSSVGIDIATADMSRKDFSGWDGGECPEFPPCRTPADCCNGAVSCIGIGADGIGWCGAKSYEPCNYDRTDGPIIYCYSGGVCHPVDHLCR